MSYSTTGARVAPHIHGLVCDVDGVLTNGLVGYGMGGSEVVFFDVHDGLAMRLASWYGIRVAWISGRMSDPVMRRARTLDVPLYSGISDKAVGLRAIARDFGLDLSELAYVGDDLSDLRAMQLVGFPVAVATACREVKDRASFITQAPGGQGAVREVVEAILQGKGCWEAAVNRYLEVLSEPELACTMPRTAE